MNLTKTIILCALLLFSTYAMGQDVVINGADRTEEYLPLLKGKRVALVINHTSLMKDEKTSLLDTLLNRHVNIKKVFAPEHGFRGDADAGEVVKNGKDVKTGVPIVSLYGNTKKPTPEHLKDVDIVVFDIQDVGARFYTYISTMFYVMEACAQQGKEVVVLDRPNPNDLVDGPMLKPTFKSFVGLLPIPLLHGCTVGELAKMINGEGWINKTQDACQLTVVPCVGWQHGQPYSLPVKPSPNLPNDQSIRLYPSLCPFEGTNISVGRGTKFPFQVIGAPAKKYGSFSFTPIALPGFDKNPLHKDTPCYGLDLRQVDDVQGIDLRYLLSFYNASGENSAFFNRPRFFDLLMGTDAVRKAIIAGKSEEEIREMWQDDLNVYKPMRQKYLIYE